VHSYRRFLLQHYSNGDCDYICTYIRSTKWWITCSFYHDIGILYLAGLTYLNVVWQFANVVTVLEDSYGFEAMMKSKELIKEKMSLSIFITLQFNLCFFVIRFLFGMLVVNGWKLFELNLMSRISIGFVCFLFLSHLFLLILVIQTVLYFVCKSYHNQNIDKCFASLEHVKVHQGEYVIVV